MTSRKNGRRFGLAIALAGAGGVPALGQTPPGTGHTLAGPEVRGRDRPSIVRRDLYGVLQRPEETPEEAAVRELELSPEERAAAEQVFIRRLRRIDAWVAGHAGLIVRLKRASDAQPLAERVALVFEGITAVEPFARGPSLWDQVRAALPAKAGADFDRMLTEYWDALAASGRARIPGVLDRFAIVSKERLDILGREIEQSLTSLGDSGKLAVAALTSGMDLSPAQRSQLAVMAAHYDQTAEVPPTGDQKRALALRVLSILGPAQRERVMELLGGN